MSPALQGVLDALTPLPAYVAGARWDVVAWNEAARRVVCDASRGIGAAIARRLAADGGKVLYYS